MLKREKRCSFFAGSRAFVVVELRTRDVDGRRRDVSLFVVCRFLLVPRVSLAHEHDVISNIHD